MEPANTNPPQAWGSAMRMLQGLVAGVASDEYMHEAFMDSYDEEQQQNIENMRLSIMFGEEDVLADEQEVTLRLVRVMLRRMRTPLGVTVDNIRAYHVINHPEQADTADTMIRNEIARIRVITMPSFGAILDALAMPPNMEDVKLTIRKEDLDALPIVKYETLECKEDRMCVICQEDFAAQDDVRLLQCKHVFHPACVDAWLTSTSYKCPVCRSAAGSFETNIEEQEEGQ